MKDAALTISTGTPDSICDPTKAQPLQRVRAVVLQSDRTTGRGGTLQCPFPFIFSSGLRDNLGMGQGGMCVKASLFWGYPAQRVPDASRSLGDTISV